MKKLTLIMPAKNAAKYLENTLLSISRQTAKDQITIKMILGDSEDDTRSKFQELCNRFCLDYIITEESGDYYISVYQAFFSLKTDYFAIMCFSDAYISQTYLEDAIKALDNNIDASYVHADILTLYENGSLRNGLYLREIVRSESGPRFTANICLIDDGINELTFVGRANQAKILLQIAIRNRKLSVNPYGALFTMYLIFGCTGVFTPRFSSFGRHHEDSRNNNKQLAEFDGQWREIYTLAQKLTLNNIIEGRYAWRNGLLETISSNKHIDYMSEFQLQINYIQFLNKQDK
jgi:glycosyltransferase involved in cell wall biosynthesis